MKSQTALAASALALILAALPAGAMQKASYQHYLKALLLSNQGNYAEALREYEDALELDPQSAFMYEQAAELALDMGKTERALEFATRLVELSPKNGKAYYLLGNVYWGRGEFDNAKSAFEKTLEFDPEFSQALFALGNLLSSQSPDKARKYLKDYLAQYPDNASDAHFQLAVIERRTGRKDAAIEHLRAAVELDPDNMQAYYSLAQIYEVARDTQTALEVYGKILSRDPRNVALLNHVGEIYYLLDDAESALDHFLRAKVILPNNPTTCLWLALLAEQEGDYKKAAQSVQDSSSLGVEASLNLRLSYYLTQDNRLKEAVDVLDKAHEKWPGNEEISYFLALGYDDLKEPVLAIALMHSVLESRPDHRDARFQLGALYEKTGDIVNTEIQFREILRRHPDDASALNFLGYSLADRNIKLDEAEEMILRAVTLNPKNGAYVDSLAWVHFRKGKFVEALSELRRAWDLMPNDDAIASHLAQVHAQLGEKGEAWMAWKRAQLIAPKKTEYEEEAAKLERGFTPEELGRHYQAFLLSTLGRYLRFGGPCLITGEIAGKKLKFQGILHYKAPWDLRVDILGPMFVPIFGVAVHGEDGFEMDPLDLGGIPQEVLREKLYMGLKLLRDFFEGGLLRDAGAVYKKGWRHPKVVTSKGTMYFNKDRTRLAVVQAPGRKGLRLGLSEYGLFDGNWVPRLLRLEGRGFMLQFKLSSMSVTFEKGPALTPAAAHPAD